MDLGPVRTSVIYVKHKGGIRDKFLKLIIMILYFKLCKIVMDTLYIYLTSRSRIEENRQEKISETIL